MREKQVEEYIKNSNGRRNQAECIPLIDETKRNRNQDLGCVIKLLMKKKRML